jgi:glycosyltransferase involved in cell wall biosynthesis
MRLVIDLQACQAASRKRGIGRYSLSLAQSMARYRGEHEVLILLSDQFPETIEPIRSVFQGLLPPSAIRIWKSLGNIRASLSGRDTYRAIARRAREDCLISLQPDFIHVTSLFEGFYDDVLVETQSSFLQVPVAVSLYDLIPLLYPKAYLADRRQFEWYQRKLVDLARADLCLTISNSTREDAIEHLRLSPSRLINISADADPHFRLGRPPPEEEMRLRQRFGLDRSFVMSVGGADPRKGMPALIRAFAMLSPMMRQKYQLVISCELNRAWSSTLRDLACREGLGPEEMVLTGYLSDSDLVALYNLCQLSVCPSEYEGFGLPVLEAMRCGAPVIASRSSSHPEVVGWDEALFSPSSVTEMACLMTRALTEPGFRQSLVDNSARQATRFSWEATARTALASMEQYLSKRSRLRSETAARPALVPARPRMAFISPLPPERSGISDYSAQLLPALSRFYEIDVIVNQSKVSDDWVQRHCAIRSVQDFVEKGEQYDRVVYQFGNSHFHSHMFSLLDQYPGVVVLHDFFLSGVLSHLESRSETRQFWIDALFHSHGYPALHDYFHGTSRRAVALRYPGNLPVIEAGVGVIVHSRHAIDLARSWYGYSTSDFSLIPLVRSTDLPVSRDQARKMLRVPDDWFLVCSFGYLSPSKLNHRLLNAWSQVMLRGRSSRSLLLFVGENPSPPYQIAIAQQIAELGLAKTVRITGWTDTEKFQAILAAADLCIQLRSESRGETSAAVLDCMNFGQATIINAHGSMADIRDSTVFKLPDDFTDECLAQAISRMMDNSAERHELGRRAREEITLFHSPDVVAARYAEAIERHYQYPAKPRRGQKPCLYIDVTELTEGAVPLVRRREAESRLVSWLCRPELGYRVEPVYRARDSGLRRAQRYAFALMKIPVAPLDSPVEVTDRDTWLQWQSLGNP